MREVEEVADESAGKAKRRERRFQQVKINVRHFASGGS